MSAGIFSLIPEDRLQDILQTLHITIELPIRLLGSRGEVLISYGEGNGYCDLLKRHVFTRDECSSLHRKGGERAKALGETYIFTCHSGLNHISFPLISQDELIASILIGPFLMDRPDSTLVAGVMEAHPLSPALALELYDGLSDIAIIPPARVNHLSRLVGHLLSPLMPDGRAALLLAREKLHQQSRINETIQMYKEQGTPATRSYFREKETALLTKVRTGSVREAKALLNDLLGYVLFSEGGRLEAVRMHAIELTTLLSRIAMDGGARADSIYRLNGQFFALMSREQNLDAICHLLQDVVEGFMDAMFTPTDKGNPHIRRALQYMAANYAQPLSIASVAAELGLSPNYFASLFRETVGLSFREQLNHIRIEEGKQLLLGTDAPLTEVALALGFPDQSCFCKAFKRIVGITPGKFRN